MILVEYKIPYTFFLRRKIFSSDVCAAITASGAEQIESRWDAEIQILTIRCIVPYGFECEAVEEFRTLTGKPKQGGKTLGEYIEVAHQDNVKAGWHDSPREKGTLLMLIVSEVAEAMEGERKDLMDDKLSHRKMAEVELADACIRIFDYAGLHGYDLVGAIDEKLEYNRHRLDHKREVRAAEGGKKF